MNLGAHGLLRFGYRREVKKNVVNFGLDRCDSMIIGTHSNLRVQKEPRIIHQEFFSSNSVGIFEQQNATSRNPDY